jgi:hypothetical protein
MLSTNIGFCILGLACILLHLLNSKFIPTAACHTTNHIRRNTLLHRVYVSNETNPSSKRTLTNGKLTYNFGHLITNIKVVLILWGGFSKVRYAKELQNFYSAIVTHSSWYHLLSQEYSTLNQTIGYGSLHFTYSFDLAPVGVLSRYDIESHLYSLIDRGLVPLPDANTYLAIHFAPGTHPDDFCLYDCAWHSSTLYGIQNMYYGIIPDQDSCPMGCGTGLATLLSTTSHELAEAVTDPTGEGWMDRTIGAEIADLCWDNGTTIGSDGKVYVIQKLWSNTAGKCISGLMFPTNRPTKKPIRKSPTKKR